jgi:hypothetical protein
MKHRAQMWCVWLLALVVVPILLPGCVQINIVDRTPTITLPTAELDSFANADKHDLAVLAIDFDPPLEYEQIMASREGITLLVAVENSGGNSEDNVTVQVELATDEGQTIVLKDESLIPAIAPGEIKIARFKSLGDIPYRTAYQLKVWVAPVTGEALITNNQKSYDLYITQPE